MSPEIDLRVRLDRELDLLPTVSPEAYLREGQRVRRRRRSLAVAGVAAAAAVSVAAVQLVAPGGASRSDSIADDPTSTEQAVPEPAIDPDFVAPEPNNPVEAVDWASVADTVDWFTTDDIPRWAQEYGNHGPIALTDDGRLWVAPDATIRRIVIDPLARGEDGTVASYAVEAECACLPEDMVDGVAWVFTSTDGTGSGAGLMDVPGWSTDDFELWVDGATATAQGRPSISERFAHFADRTSGRMVAGAPEVTLVQQEPDAYLGSGRVRHTRAGAAQVEYAGQTFYVVGVDPEEGAAWYRYWPGDEHADFDAFLTFLRGNW